MTLDEKLNNITALHERRDSIISECHKLREQLRRMRGELGAQDESTIIGLSRGYRAWSAIEKAYQWTTDPVTEDWEGFHDDDSDEYAFVREVIELRLRHLNRRRNRIVREIRRLVK